jgi:hypothetical protein
MEGKVELDLSHINITNPFGYQEVQNASLSDADRETL